MINIENSYNEFSKLLDNFSLYRFRSIFESMEYVELDFLGSAKEIDPHFIELYEKITDHKINFKKKIKRESIRVQN